MCCTEPRVVKTPVAAAAPTPTAAEADDQRGLEWWRPWRGPRQRPQKKKGKGRDNDRGAGVEQRRRSQQRPRLPACRGGASAERAGLQLQLLQSPALLPAGLSPQLGAPHVSLEPDRVCAVVVDLRLGGVWQFRFSVPRQLRVRLPLVWLIFLRLGIVRLRAVRVCAGRPLRGIDNVLDTGSVRLRIRPRDAQVFVDGYFAGYVDDFDGNFQSLRLEQGGHKLEVRMPGYETLQLDVHVQPNRTITLREDLIPRP